MHTSLVRGRLDLVDTDVAAVDCEIAESSGSHPTHVPSDWESCSSSGCCTAASPSCCRPALISRVAVAGGRPNVSYSVPVSRPFPSPRSKQKPITTHVLIPFPSLGLLVPTAALTISASCRVLFVLPRALDRPVWSLLPDLHLRQAVDFQVHAARAVAGGAAVYGCIDGEGGERRAGGGEVVG